MEPSSTEPNRPIGPPSTIPAGPMHGERSEMRDAAGSLASDAKQTARDLQEEGSRAARDVASEAKSTGQDIAEMARDKAESMAEQGKEAGAQQGEGLAQAARRIADDLEERSPEIARHVRGAADSIDSMAQSLRQRSVGELIQEMNGFAQRQPAAFFGVAMLAGFAAVRFAKSSGGPAGSGMTSAGTAMRPGLDSRPDRGGPPQEAFRPATLPAATLGGAAAHKPGTAMPGSMPGPDAGRV